MLAAWVGARPAPAAAGGDARVRDAVAQFVFAHADKPLRTPFISKVLVGALATDIADYKHDPMFGCLRGTSREAVSETINKMIREQAFISVTADGVVPLPGATPPAATVVAPAPRVAPPRPLPDLRTPGKPAPARPAPITPEWRSREDTYTAPASSLDGPVLPSTLPARPPMRLPATPGVSATSTSPCTAYSAPTPSPPAASTTATPFRPTSSPTTSPTPPGSASVSTTPTARPFAATSFSASFSASFASAASSASSASSTISFARAGTPAASTAASSAGASSARFANPEDASALVRDEHSPEAATLAGETAGLSEEQELVRAIALHGKSLFFTGSAGTGKSFLLRQIIRDLVARYPGQYEVNVTASTGIAACNIGGTTIHSFAGVGLGDADAETLARGVLKGQAASRWRLTKVLIIDEISMLDGRLLDKLEYIARRVRNNQRPFGGIQVLLCGDFFQLPPVGHSEGGFGAGSGSAGGGGFRGGGRGRGGWGGRGGASGRGGFGAGDGGFRFEYGGSAGDADSPGHDDGGARGGRRGRGSRSRRGAGSGRGSSGGDIADMMNGSQWKAEAVGVGASETPTFCFEAACWNRVVAGSIVLHEVFRQRDPAFIRFLNALRVGEVHPWMTELLRRRSGTKLAELERSAAGIRPTRLYSRNVDVDRENAAALAACPGEEQVFQAVDVGVEPLLTMLKRNARAPERLVLKVGAQVILLKNMDLEQGLVNGITGKVVAFEANRDHSTRRHFPIVPVVQFFSHRGEPFGPIPVKSESWSVGSGDAEASRTQIPLKLAYALSVHKSQGMTIEFVEVSLRGVFEPGQAYVALSRAVSLEGLRVSQFDPRAIRAHPKVVSFQSVLEEEHKRTVAIARGLEDDTESAADRPDDEPTDRPTANPTLQSARPLPPLPRRSPTAEAGGGGGGTVADQGARGRGPHNGRTTRDEPARRAPDYDFGNEDDAALLAMIAEEEAAVAGVYVDPDLARSDAAPASRETPHPRPTAAWKPPRPLKRDRGDDEDDNVSAEPPEAAVASKRPATSTSAPAAAALGGVSTPTAPAPSDLVTRADLLATNAVDAFADLFADAGSSDEDPRRVGPLLSLARPRYGGSAAALDLTGDALGDDDDNALATESASRHAMPHDPVHSRAARELEGIDVADLFAADDNDDDVV